MNLVESYFNMYSHTNFDQDLYEVLLEICISQQLFETVEECEYFSEQLVVEDLTLQFLHDFAESHELDISDFLEEAAAGTVARLGLQAARGVVNALSKSGRMKVPGLDGGALGRQAMEKGANVVKGAAASSSVRSARAARGPGVEFQKPGKYLDMLKAKTPTAGSPAAKQPSQQSLDARNWMKLSKAAEPYVPAKPKPAPQPKVDLFNMPAKTTGGASGPRWQDWKTVGGASGPRPGKTIRATGPTGNFPQLDRFINRPAPGPLTTSTQALNIGRGLRTAATLGLGAAAMQSSTSSKDTPSTTSTDKYNTKDTDGTVRSRLAVGPKNVGPKIVGPKKVGTVAQAFDKEYAKQKSSGAKSFSFQGKQYTTDSYDPFDIVMNHLLDEGYADDVEGAEVIMINMSEEWRENIIAEKTRFAKETGINYRKGKKQPEGGSAKGDKAYQSVNRMMRNTQGRPEGQRPKTRGEKPPAAGERGSERKSPEQIVKNRRATRERGQDLMHSRYD